MADSISFEYRESEDVVLVTINSAVSGNEFRNPLMASCNLLREKSGAAYLFDVAKDFTLDEEDTDWFEQHFIPLVKRSAAGRIILIVPEDDPRRAEFDERFEKQIGYFYAADYESALKVLKDEDIREANAATCKIAGKTRKDWRDLISYIWFKYWIFPVAIAIVTCLVIGVFFKSKNDVIVYSFGYFELDDAYMEEVLKTEGFTVPYFPSAIVVMPNQEGKKPTGYDQESASAYFMTTPDVIVSDGVTYSYYYSSFGVYPESYQKIMDGLNEETKKHVEPVYMSAADAQEAIRKFNTWSGKGDPDIDDMDLPDDNKTKAIIGLRLNDEEACKKLGYRTGWTKSDSKMIFSMYAKCTDREKAEKAIIAILNSAY